MGKFARVEFARTRLPVLSDNCVVTPPERTGRPSFSTYCSVQTPSLKLGHGYGHEGGGPTVLSRRVDKSILFDRDIHVASGDSILWVEEGIKFTAGDPNRKSAAEPYVMVNATLDETENGQ